MSTNIRVVAMVSLLLLGACLARGAESMSHANLARMALKLEWMETIAVLWPDLPVSEAEKSADGYSLEMWRIVNEWPALADWLVPVAAAPTEGMLTRMDDALRAGGAEAYLEKEREKFRKKFPSFWETVDPNNIPTPPGWPLPAEEKTTDAPWWLDLHPFLVLPAIIAMSLALSTLFVWVLAWVRKGRAKRG